MKIWKLYGVIGINRTSPSQSFLNFFPLINIIKPLNSWLIDFKINNKQLINIINLNLNRRFLSFVNNRGNVFIPSLVKYKYQDGDCSLMAERSAVARISTRQSKLVLTSASPRRVSREARRTREKRVRFPPFALSKSKIKGVKNDN